MTLGYLYAVEAAATGGVLLLAFGALDPHADACGSLRDVLRDTLAVTGALFALLVGATVFTLVLRALGTDRWVAAALAALPGGAAGQRSRSCSPPSPRARSCSTRSR